MNTLNRLMRLIALAVMLVTTLPGSVINAHADCGGILPSAANPAGAHDHATPDSAHHHAGIAHSDVAHSDMAVADMGGADRGVTGSDAAGDAQTPRDGLAKFCHSAAAGCPGCVAPAEATLPQPGASQIFFRHVSVFGESAERSSVLRPPSIS